MRAIPDASLYVKILQFVSNEMLALRISRFMLIELLEGSLACLKSTNSDYGKFTYSFRKSEYVW
jgi:hypothetical protein